MQEGEVYTIPCYKGGCSILPKHVTSPTHTSVVIDLTWPCQGKIQGIFFFAFLLDSENPSLPPLKLYSLGCFPPPIPPLIFIPFEGVI